MDESLSSLLFDLSHSDFEFLFDVSFSLFVGQFLHSEFQLLVSVGFGGGLDFDVDGAFNDIGVEFFV